MYDRRLKRLPVVNEAGRLIGIISRVDVLSVFDRPDDQIRRELAQQVLPGVVQGARRGINVRVRDGIVTLAGPVRSDHEGQVIVDAARHLQGVVAVRDRLSYPARHSANGGS
jgi:CBS-domain-containing membrane protein